jgi:predicted transcriptional regulator
MTEKPSKYRSQIRIYTDILRTIEKERGNAGPTHVLYGANLSHDRLIKYLAHLKESGLIEEMGASDKVTYSLTGKGIEFLKEFRKICQFTEAFGFII